MKIIDKVKDYYLGSVDLVEAHPHAASWLIALETAWLLVDLFKRLVGL